MSGYSENELKESISNTSGVKLFVGQIPREMDEDTLIPYFAEFGPIVELTVIRDRVTKIHKGCAFVTYLESSSAQQAIEQLHDKIKLGHAINPLQVRIAECQVERENKLFIGMLPKTVTEEQLHDMFVRYGDLREVHIIRGPEGSSKGCAFVKFVEREAALMAIDEMNNKIPDGSTRPLVIKFADVKKHGKKVDGEDYVVDQMQMSGAQAKESSFWQQPQVSTSQYYYPYNYSQGGGVPLPQQVMQSYVPYGTQATQHHDPYIMVNSQYGSNMAYTSNDKISPSVNGFMSSQLYSRQTDIDTQSTFRQQPQSPVENRYDPTLPISPSTSSQRLASSEFDDSPQSPTRPPEGPSGANLFIYHLPRDLTDADLATLFAPFGNVISAKVFVDKKTSDSKGFGFVSFDSIESADASIASMNGFQIGSKRLKVQHKRTGEDPQGSPIHQMNEMYSIPAVQMLPSGFLQNPNQIYASPQLLDPQAYVPPLRSVFPTQMPPNAQVAYPYGFRANIPPYGSDGRGRQSGPNGMSYPSFVG